MKFLLSSSLLLRALSRIARAIPTNPIVPILENFLFRIEGAELTVTAGDLYTTMQTTVLVESTDSGQICIPAKLLLDTLRSLPEQPLTFAVNLDKFGIQITAQSGKFKLSGENAVDYPKTPTLPDTAGRLTLGADALLDALNNTLFATHTDELRPAMTGVYMNLNGERAEFVATDGHRLIRYRRTDITSTANTGFIVPRKALSLLKNALKPGEEVSIRYSLANALFSFGSMQLTCRLIDERFPNYENAIPTQNPYLLTVERADLVGALKRMAIYTNRTTYQIRLTLTRDKLVISTEDLDYSNEADETLLCDYEGADLEIGFNAKLLTECLGNVQAKTVSIELSAPNRAAITRPVDSPVHEDLLVLNMPVMLNTYA